MLANVVVIKMRLSGLELRIVFLESGALPACPFPAGYLFVHCAHFIALSMPFHYNVSILVVRSCGRAGAYFVAEQLNVRANGKYNRIGLNFLHDTRV